MSRDDIRAESPADSGGYNNAHRAFVQAFFSKPVMTTDEIAPVLSAVMSAQGMKSQSHLNLCGTH
jgi:hypothetical protein